MTSKSNWPRWLILALSVGYLVQPWAVAAGQVPGSATPQSQTRRQSIRPNLDERVSQFAKNLGLTEAQQSAVKKILEQQKREIRWIRTDPSLTGSAAIERLRALQERTVAQIRAVLTYEQKKNYNPLAPRTLPQTPQPSVEDWLKATTPPQWQP